MKAKLMQCQMWFQNADQTKLTSRNVIVHDGDVVEQLGELRNISEWVAIGTLPRVNRDSSR